MYSSSASWEPNSFSYRLHKMREIVHVKLDMLHRISFGHREHIKAMLEAAEVEIQEWLNGVGKRPFSQVDAAVFDEVHKLKTTFAMLEAGRCIQLCQVVLDQKGNIVDEQTKETWDTLIGESRVVLEDIYTFLKEGWD